MWDNGMSHIYMQPCKLNSKSNMFYVVLYTCRGRSPWSHALPHAGVCRLCWRSVPPSLLFFSLHAGSGHAHGAESTGMATCLQGTMVGPDVLPSCLPFQKQQHSHYRQSNLIAVCPKL